MTVSDLSSLWRRLSTEGWASGHLTAAAVYPMPGTPGFDEDGRFLDQPLFPGGMTGALVRVRDTVWEMPEAWFREMETRPLHYLRHDFSVEANVADRAAARRAVLAAKRCLYLEMFRPRRPVALATLRVRWGVYMAFARHAAVLGRDLTTFDYADIADVVGSLNVAQRGSLLAVYELLRWWKASAPGAYRMFDPPPSLEALDGDADEDAEAPCRDVGLDTDHVRGDAQDEPEDRKYQPFPDAFVAAAGEFCLSILDELRPAVTACLRDLMRVPELDRADALPGLLEGREWPLGIEVENGRNLRSAAHLCQTAAIFVLSLVLGPRWSEVSALPSKAVTPRVVDGTTIHFLDGSTFKMGETFRGEARDWPVNDRIAGYLHAQREYVGVVEGESFRFLWRSHQELWGGGQPLRQIDGVLKKFAAKFGFGALLEGTNCHHHRFRKTTARLIVIALHGGPLILRRLFGHEHLAMTLRYILANQSIVDELRAIAEEEQRRIARTFVERREEVRGGGAEPFRQAVASVIGALDVHVPEGKRDQEKVTSSDILDFVADGPDGLSVKQIIPGLIACFKPGDEAGRCCKAGELPNVAKCDSGCGWHLEMPEFLEQARINVVDALRHLADARPGTLTWGHYARVVRQRLEDYPELASEHEDDPVFAAVMEDPHGDTG